MKKFKIFIDIATSLQPWINSWATKGFRLMDIKGCMYTFEKTEKQFRYAVQFIGANSYKSNKQYTEMLKESGLNVFLRPINQLSFNYGKIRFRPYVEGIDKVSTSLNGYNKELLIVEMYENEFTELLTDRHDLIKYYSGIRNAYMQGLICVVALFIFGSFNINFFELHLKEMIFLGVLFVLIVILSSIVYRMQKNININRKK